MNCLQVSSVHANGSRGKPAQVFSTAKEGGDGRGPAEYAHKPVGHYSGLRAYFEAVLDYSV